MTTPLPGFVLLSLVLGFPRLVAGESAESAAGGNDPASPRPDTAPSVAAPPVIEPPVVPAASVPASANGEPKPRSLVLGALRQSFPYDPSVRAKSAPVAAADAASPGTNGSDVVVLPKVEVTSRPLANGLAEAIANQRPATRPQNHSRFGTGIHEKDFGKVRASAVTIFYIPVLVGFSW